MTARRVRFTLLLAVLVLAPCLASAATSEFRVLFDVDHDPSTGCTVGTMNGVDQIFVTQATSDTTTASVVQTHRLVCSAGAFGSPVDVNTTGWPGAVDAETGTITIETRVPFSAFQASGLPFNMHLGFVGTSGPASQALLNSPTGAVLLYPADSPGRRRAIDFGDPRVIIMDGQLADWGTIPPMAARELGAGDTGFQFTRAYVWANPNDQFIYFAIQAKVPNGTGPTANDDNYVRSQGQALTIPVAKGVLKNDVDPNGLPLTATKVSEPNHGNVTLNPDGSFQYIPTTPAAVEEDHFTYSASNGSQSSNVAKVTIEVNAKPKVKNATFTLAENVPNGTIVGVVDVTDEAGDSHTFQILNGNTGGAFAITPLPNGDGQITVANRNAVNFEVNPTFTLTVKVTDEGGLSDTGIITINLTNVNDVPTVQNDSRTVAEDQILTVPVPGLYAFANDEDGNTLTLSIVANAAHGVVTLNPDGSWSYDSDPNYNGPDSFTWHAFDGSVFSSTATVNITVTPVNDAPSFTAGSNVNSPEDTPYNAPWATAISAGPADEAGQTLTFTVVATTPSLFLVQPAIDASGNLTFTPALNANGSTNVDVTLVDNGGGTNSSGTVSFTITITPVNDAPSFVKGLDQTVAEDAGAQTVNGWATSISAGPADEAGQTVTFNVTGNTNPSLFSVAPAIASNGTLTYTPAADANGVATITITLSDDGTPVATSAAQTFTITVTAVNDAPVLTAGGVLNYTENAAPMAADTTITVSDVDSTTLSSATVQITGNYVNGEDVLSYSNALGITGSFNAGSGTLTLTGVASVANYETALRNVLYSNTSDNPSTAMRTLAWQVNDGAGVNNLSAVVNSTINVTAVNDAPVIVSGNTVGYTENGAPIPLNGAIVVTDADSTNLQGAVVMISANASLGSDVLACPACGGTITASYNSGSGVLTLSGTDTVANYQTALRSVTFVNTSDNPSVAQRGIDWFVTDTSAAQNVDNASNDTYVNITAINDAPVLTAGGALNYSEGQAATAIDGTITVADPDSPTMLSATAQITANYVNGEDVLSYVTALGITGSFNATTGTLTLTGVAPLADYQTALRNVLYNNTSENPSTTARTVTWQINDGAGVNNLSLTVTSTINVATVNDAPVVTAAPTFAYTEGTGVQVIDNALTISDVDDTQMSGATVQITANYVSGEDILAFVNAFGITGSFNAGSGTLTLSGTTTIANYESALRTITYQNTSSSPSVAPRTLTWTVSDIAPLGGSDTTTINITAVNSAPTITSGAGAPTTFTEDGSPVQVDATLVVTDADTLMLAGATITISANYASGEDFLQFANTANITGSFNAGTGTMTLTGLDTVANYQTALRNVMFENTSDNPSTTQRTISWQVNDGESVDNLSSVLQTALDVVAVNDAPEINAAAALAYTEDAGAVVIDGTLTVTDLDHTTLPSATVQITGGYVSGEDVLAFTNAFGITGSFNAGSGTLTLSGSASVSNYQSALRTVTYQNTSQDPSTAARTVTWGAFDGIATGNDTTTITITAANDAPSVNAATFNVDENSANGTSVGTVTYTDPDAGQTHTFSITAGNTGSAFAINSSTGEITVATASALNFEVTPTFSLTVQVDDNGTPVLNGTATITINLNNVNDAPVVNDQSFSVDENSANGTVVGTVAASDEDAGQTLTYSITAGNTGTAFAINASTGQITVANPINYEATSSYSLTVQVQDNGAGNLTDTATVTITVNNLNEAPLASNQSFNVNENSAGGTVVGTVSATDPDAGQTLTYSITAGNTGGAFAINSATGEITVANTLNFEALSSYVLTVTISDNGAPTQAATPSVTININDVNEAPVVDPATFSLNENSPNATSVGTVTFTEPDGGGQTHTFAITAGNTGGAFAINASTGEITVANSGAVNFETTPTFSLTVQVTDNGTPNLNGTATITINLNDVNDAPVIGNQTFAVNENSANGTVVGSVAASDEDAGQTLTYAITGGNTGNVFAINASTGQITVVGALNYEGPDDPYLLTVQVTDNAGSPLSSSATITINLNDVNEAPVLNDASRSINENSANGTNVGALLPFTDEDVGQTHTFAITAGNTGGVFAISNSGQITVANVSQLNYEVTQSYSLTVQVTDNGTPNLNDTATVTVTVVDVNEAPTAVTDTYNALSGTSLFIAGGIAAVPGTTVASTGDVSGSPRTTGTKANDTDPDTLNVSFSTLTITTVTGNAGPTAVPPASTATTTTTNGTVMLHADGSFIYTPKAGYTGADSFTYVINDGLNNATGTVNITVVGPALRYVKNDVLVAGNGTSAAPHQTLAAAISASAAGELIYVMRGDGTATNYGGMNVMKANQKLWGQGVDLDVTTTNAVTLNNLIVASSLSLIGPDAGANPTISIANVAGVEVRGLSINGGTSNAVDVTTSGASNGGLTFIGNTITAAGLEGIDVNHGSSGSMTLDIQGNTITSTGNGVDIARTSTGTTSISYSNNSVTSGASGVVISGGAATASTITAFANNFVMGNTAGTGFNLSNVTFDGTAGGTFQQVSGGVLTVGASGNGVGANGFVCTSCAGDISFSNLNSYADSGAALRASGLAAFTGSAGLRIVVTSTNTDTLSATGGPAVDFVTVTTTLQPSVITSTNTATTGVNLDGVSGTFTAGSGSSINSSNGAATAFDVNASAASVTYNGTITVTGGKGVDLTSNTGGTIAFTGLLNISSGTSAAFNATGGGTISSTNTSSSLATTTATALNVSSTTIGASNLTFRSISAGSGGSGPASGIILNNTGSGRLIVTGNGSACTSVGTCTGGAIQNTSSHAISMTSTNNPSFTRMAIQNSAGSGVEGTGVTGFTFTEGFIDNSGTGGGADDSNIAFNNQATGTENNISGTVTITNNTLTNARWHGVMLQNFNGTIDDVVMTGNTITSSTALANSLGYGINLQILGSATTVSNVTKGNISSNTITNFPSGGGIQVQGGNSNAAGPAGTLGTPGSGTNIINIKSNLIKGQSAANRMNTSAILYTVTGKGQGNVDISNNGTIANPLAFTTGTTIGVGANGNTTLTAITNGNVITSFHPSNGGTGISGGTGVTFGVTDTPSMNWTINNNVISNTDGNGILAVARGATGSLTAKIQNNTVSAPLGGVRPGIRVDAGNTTAGTDDDVCLNISGNSSAGSGGTQGIGLRKQGTSNTVHAFGVNGMAATATPGIEAYVNGLNPAGGGTLLISATTNFTNCSNP